MRPRTALSAALAHALMLALLSAAGPAAAQAARKPAVPASGPAPAQAGRPSGSTPPPPVADAQPALAEPAVRRTVVEDDRARVEELRVRGEVRHITVTPKNGARPYEVLPADVGRDLPSRGGTQRGAAGQRVWNVLDF